MDLLTAILNESESNARERDKDIRSARQLIESLQFNDNERYCTVVAAAASNEDNIDSNTDGEIIASVIGVRDRTRDLVSGHDYQI